MDREQVVPEVQIISLTMTKIQLQIYPFQTKRKKYLFPIWSTPCSFCMLEYFSVTTWLQDPVSCQILVLLYTYNICWINYIKCFFKSPSWRSQGHLLFMIKGEEASINFILTTKTLQALAYSGRCKCLESGEVGKPVKNVEKKEQWHLFKMLPCQFSDCWHQVQAQVGTPHPDCLSWPIVEVSLVCFLRTRKDTAWWYGHKLFREEALLSTFQPLRKAGLVSESHLQ